MRPVLLMLSLLALAAPAAAQTQADRLATGRAVAERWCANCHATGGAGQRSAGDAAPGFREIAQRPGVTAEGLAAFIQAPHGTTMPDHRLSRAELDGVVAWILAQRR